MNLQAKLTLGYVLLAVLIVSIISGVDLATNMQQQFDATLERAEILNPVATKFVKRDVELAADGAAARSAARQRPGGRPARSRHQDGRHSGDRGGRSQDQRGVRATAISRGSARPPVRTPTFGDLVKRAGIVEKIKVLWPRANEDHYYQIEQALATPTAKRCCSCA